MLPFRSIAEQEVYPDDPEFAGEFLFPAIKAGHGVTLVTAFTPSYLFTLVSQLAENSRKSHGLLKIVFCVPLIETSGLNKARLFSKYLCAYASSADEVRNLLKSLKSLTQQGRIQLSALVSGTSQMLTPSCLGLVESSEHGSEDLITFVDLIADDLNSPITIAKSWVAESAEFSKVKSSISKALFFNFPNMHRLANSEMLDILDEILLKGYPKQDVSKEDSRSEDKTGSEKGAGGKKFRPGKKVTKPVAKPLLRPVVQRSTEEDLDQEEDDDLLALELMSDDEIEKIIDEISFRDQEYYSESIDEFLGVGYFDSGLDIELTRAHAGPMAESLAELFGHSTAVCWCGEEYDTSVGCLEYLY